eukprot:1068909-Amphidinium_carterae.1
MAAARQADDASATPSNTQPEPEPATPARRTQTWEGTGDRVLASIQGAMPGAAGVALGRPRARAPNPPDYL